MLKAYHLLCFYVLLLAADTALSLPLHHLAHSSSGVAMRDESKLPLLEARGDIPSKRPPGSGGPNENPPKRSFTLPPLSSITPTAPRNGDSNIQNILNLENVTPRLPNRRPTGDAANLANLLHPNNVTPRIPPRAPPQRSATLPTELDGPVNDGLDYSLRTEDGAYLCVECKQKCARQQDLKRHYESLLHGGAQPDPNAICRDCGKAYASVGILENHLTTVKHKETVRKNLEASRQSWDWNFGSH